MKTFCLYARVALVACAAWGMVAPSPRPRVIIIGDSTVRNGSGEGRGGQWGWGDRIACYFDTARVDVINKAIGGRSSRTFITGGRWDDVRESLRAGDFVLIQFGHNDASPVNDTSRARGTLPGVGEETVEIDNLLTGKRETVHTFGWYLRRYARETKALGATPVILSPIPRNNAREGKITRAAGSYGGWAREVAAAEGVPFIDLNERSAGELERIIARFGQATIDSMYYRGDHTHTALAGAMLNARLVVDGIRELQGCALKEYLLDRTYRFDAGNALEERDGARVFSTALPEGDYDVTVWLGDPGHDAVTTVRGESRRLFLEQVRTRKGETSEYSFTVNVRNRHIDSFRDVRLKPRERRKLNWDDLLTLEFTGTRPSVRGIRVRPAGKALTVFLCGNSTVVDQDNDPWGSWGQMIPRFFREGVSFANYAESGESANTFIAAGRLEKLLSRAKAGDYLFVEFGHNDQKQRGEGKGPWLSFTSDLRAFIAAARARGMYPVLVTPVQRRRFDEDGRVVDTHGEYPDAVRALAAAEKVPLIDLHRMSTTLYEALGEEGSRAAFLHYPAGQFPGQSSALEDNTHFSTYGAYEIARCVVEGIRQNLLTEILQFARPDTPAFDPSRPDDARGFSLPLGPYVEVEN